MNALTEKQLNELEKLLGKMMKGPYEYWDMSSNDLLAGECHKGQGRVFAALPGLTSMSDEFRAVAALLNNAPALISAARENLRIVSQLRNMCESALDPTGMRLGENNGSIWAQRVLDVLDGPEAVRPPQET